MLVKNVYAQSYPTPRDSLLLLSFPGNYDVFWRLRSTSLKIPTANKLIV